MEATEKQEKYLWQAIFFCFVLAALTGVVYRYGMVWPLPAELSLQNVRHAHSHLMFFGWAAALPLFVMMRALKSRSGSASKGFGMMRKALWGILLFGLITYPFFLVYGYHSVETGGMSLPLSVIFSGLVMVCWYFYIAGYWRTRKEVGEQGRNSWFEASLVMLFISSLGAWGVAVVQAVGVASPLAGKALTHFFLSCFTEGWVVLSIVAVLDELLDIPDKEYLFSPGALAAMIMLGAPMTFPYGISESLLSPVMLYTARAGGLLAGSSLIIISYEMLKHGKATRSILIWPVVLLLIKALMQVMASVIPSGFWFSDHALRIFYLHVLLLGGFTLGGIAYLHIRQGLGDKNFAGVAVSIVLVLASLLLLTRLWPVAWSGMWIYYVVTGVALLPVLTVGAEWWKMITQRKT